MPDQEVEFVRHGLERLNALLADEDLEGLKDWTADQYHPGVQVDWSATAPDSGDGIEGVVEWVTEVSRSVQELRFEPTNIIQVGDAVVTAMRLTARSEASGLSLTMEYAVVNRFKDGKIVLSRTYQALPEALDGALADD